jgi:phospholipid transport system substrate-binding protein
MTAPRARASILMALLVFAAAAAGPLQAAPADAGNYIEALATQTLKIVSSNQFSRKQKQGQLEKVFSSNVDIPWVGRFVMGRFWRQASDEQKALYIKKYEKFLVAHYASRFADYTSGSFKVTGTRDEGNNESTVSMEIIPPERGAAPLLLDYRVRQEGAGFKIFDVIVEGVSMITTQRSEFSSVIGQHGIDYLIQNLTVISEQSLPEAAK